MTDKHISFLLLGLVFTLVACVNGKGEKGTLVNADSIPPRDTVATLSPDGNDFALIEGMGTCLFDPFFDARVEANGIVKCQFRGFDDELFVSVLSADCPRDEIVIENIEGRCCGIQCLVEGSGVDPVLFMIMDDGHVERISLYELSEGTRRATLRSEQKGVINFVVQSSPDGDGQDIMGLLADSSRVDLNWSN